MFDVYEFDRGRCRAHPGSPTITKRACSAGIKHGQPNHSPSIELRNLKSICKDNTVTPHLCARSAWVSKVLKARTVCREPNDGRARDKDTDVAMGKSDIQLKLTNGHGSGQASVAYVRSKAEMLVATAGADGKVCVRDTTLLETLHRAKCDMPPARIIAADPKGKLLAVGDEQYVKVG